MKEKGFNKGLTRRLFSIVLALAMVISLMPMNCINVFAAAPDTSSWPTSMSHTGCENPYAYHFYSSGTTYSFNNETCVEGREFSPWGGSYQDYYDGGNSHLRAVAFTSGTSAGWYYQDGMTRKPCGAVHDHNFTYTLVTTAATNDTIKAICGNSDGKCGLTGDKYVTLTLTASSANYSGSAATITIGTDDEITAWEAAELTVPTAVSYEKANGTPLEAAPTTVGHYVAKVSPVGEEATEDNTAKVSFEIIPIAVTGISLDKTSMDLAKNATSALTATVSPDNATDKTVTWSTSNENVATVSSTGVVTAVGSGVAVITAECGDFSATCTVTVYANTYTLTVPATAEAAGAGFNAVGDVNVKGNIAGDKKIVVKASGSDNNTFKSTAVSTTVGYTIVKGNAAENTEIPETGLVFSQDEVNKETVTEAGTVKGTSVTVGIIVNEADYINADDGDYTTTVTWKASLSSVSAE